MRRTITLMAAGILALAGCGGSPGAGECEGVTIEAVRQAAVAVDGYSYAVTGTDLSSTFVPNPDASQPFTYEEAAFAAEGAYRAPDRGRIEVTNGLLEAPGRHSSVLEGWEWSVEEQVRVGDSAWVRVQDQPSHFTTLDRRTLVMVPNTLGPLLGGLAFGVELVDEAWSRDSDVSLTWQASRSDGQCVLTGTVALPSPRADDVQFELSVVADADTMLPSSVHFQVQVPGALTQPTRAFDLTYAFDYEPLPQIEPPVDVGPAPSLGSDASPGPT
ncbi:MAG TPA: hypothetical protein VF071_09625 [Candidatus Limnocylindria bacterium]